MKLYRFPDRFCSDSRPYWALFGLFVLANALLLYTLYTRQPERYRRLVGLFSFARAAHGQSPPPTAGWSARPAVQDRTAAVSARQANLTTQRPVGRRTALPGGQGMPGGRLVVSSSPGRPISAEFLGATVGNYRSKPARAAAKGNPPAPVCGVKIARLSKTGVPYLSGLRKGDVIVEVNRIPVSDVGGLASVLRTADLSQGLLFDVFRKKRFYYVTIEAADLVGK